MMSSVFSKTEKNNLLPISNNNLNLLHHTQTYVPDWRNEIIYKT